MRFLIDANLPFKLAKILKAKGFEIVHTDDLPDKERTTDQVIRKISTDENRIVVTKDSDFLISHLVHGIPAQLLLVTTGNIVNKKLLVLFDAHFDSIVELFNTYDLVELNEEQIIAHEKNEKI